MTATSTVDLSAIIDPAPVGRRLSLEQSIIGAGERGVIPEVVTGCLSRAADPSTVYPQRTS